jgi:hypothetical protein
VTIIPAPQRQTFEQSVFERRQMQLRLRADDGSGGEIHGDGAQTQHGQLRPELCPAAKCGPHAGQQFGRAERLRDVVIRPAIQGGDLVLFQGPRG